MRRTGGAPVGGPPERVVAPFPSDGGDAGGGARRLWESLSFSCQPSRHHHQKKTYVTQGVGGDLRSQAAVEEDAAV